METNVEEEPGDEVGQPANVRRPRFVEGDDQSRDTSVLPNPTAETTPGQDQGTHRAAGQATLELEELMTFSISPRRVRHEKRSTVDCAQSINLIDSKLERTPMSAGQVPSPASPARVQLADDVVPWIGCKYGGDLVDSTFAEAHQLMAQRRVAQAAEVHAGERGLRRAGRRAAMGPPQKNPQSADAMAHAVRTSGALLPAPQPHPKPRQATFNTTAYGRSRAMSAHDLEMLELRATVARVQCTNALQGGEEAGGGGWRGGGSSGVAPRVLSRDAFRWEAEGCAPM